MEESAASRRAQDLCSAILEDAEAARQMGFQGRGVLELHNVLPSGPAMIRHGSAPLPSELTSLIA